ncbi:MAG: hypothetical protein RQ866_08975, partial [Bacteroidales bacterium]|nr:hypothetical protein [Bacteroidales bacterium]
ATAIRAFSMDVLWQISLKYPDLLTELAASAENLIGRSTPGLENKARKILPLIYRKQFTGK